MARNYAALPHEYLEEMAELDDAEFGRLMRALLTYSMTKERIVLRGNERFYANRVMAQEERFQSNYNDIAETRSAAGKAGAAARWQNGKRIFANGENSEATPANGKNGYTETKTKTETETNTQPSNDGKGSNARKRFTPPTLAEVQSYVAERHSPVDPQGFIDFYASKGWMVGKTPMKDWKAACRNAEKWERWARNVPRGNVFMDMLREEEAHGTQ